MRSYASHLEEIYAGVLDIQKLDGAVHAWWYEPFSLRLAPHTFYLPDFLVQLANGSLEVHEVKGHWRDDARVKWKVAASLYPCFVFVAVQRRGNRWTEERL
jgi:hypothetical protein